MHPLLAHNQATVLGRTKNLIFSKITGGLDQLPSQRELMRYIMQRWKENTEDGRFQFHLIQCSGANRMQFPADFSVEDFNSVLAELNCGEIFERVYVEGKAPDQSEERTLGCLVLGHERPNGEPGYYAVSVDDRDFLERRSFTSIVPDGSNGPGRVEVLSAHGWRKVTAKDIKRFPQAVMALAALKAHLEDVRPHEVHISDLKVNERTYGPDDLELMARLDALFRNETQITTGITALSNIQPFSMAFCMQLASSGSASSIERGQRPALLVYWENGKFVMSDDYLPFLTYREMKLEEVPVAILGDFPAELVSVEKRGGYELLPPIAISRRRNTGNFDPALQDWLLDEELAKRKRHPLPHNLAAAWIVLAELLADPKTTEADIHDYLLKFPPILAPSGNAIASEVRLGNEYKIDVVIRSAGLTEDVMIIELENPNHSIFTQDGRPRKQITHAKQQVEDWLRWIREHADDEFVRTLRGLPPTGLVVIGKSRELDDDQRRRLAHLNTNSKVQVITYDELLDRFGDLILQQCDDQRH
jgi:hypothetical protein